VIAADVNTLRDKAIRFLAQREHSEYELAQKLARSCDDQAAIDALLIELKTNGLQSDDRFAENYIHYRQRRGYGPIHIANELRQRGITEDMVSKNMQRCDTDWIACARRAFVKKFSQGIAEEYDIRAKQMRFLYQRGFTNEQIQQVCSDVGVGHENG